MKSSAQSLERPYLVPLDPRLTIRGQVEGKPGRGPERKPLQDERDADVVPQTGATRVNVAEELNLRATARPDVREIMRHLAEL